MMMPLPSRAVRACSGTEGRRATEMFQKWYTLMERDLIIGLMAVFGVGFVLGFIAAAEFFRGIGKGVCGK